MTAESRVLGVSTVGGVSSPVSGPEPSKEPAPTRKGSEPLDAHRETPAEAPRLLAARRAGVDTPALTIADVNAAKVREQGTAGRTAPAPYREGAAHIRRCTACGHITRFHWYASGDLRFRGRPGTRWCQVCAGFCPVERCATKRGKARSRLIVER